jgi:hypothetical protein
MSQGAPVAMARGQATQPLSGGGDDSGGGGEGKLDCRDGPWTVLGRSRASTLTIVDEDGTKVIIGTNWKRACPKKTNGNSCGGCGDP